MDNSELLDKLSNAVFYYTERHGGLDNKDPLEIFLDLMSDFIKIVKDAIGM